MAHFLFSAAAFLIIANQDVNNVYLTFAGGLSVLYAVLVFLGGALFPAYYVYLRSSLDGQLTLLECVACCTYLVPWIALDASLIGTVKAPFRLAPSFRVTHACAAVAQTLIDGPLSWPLYFAFIVPCVDIAVCVALAIVFTHKRLTMRFFNPEAVKLVPGSAASHNDL